MKILALAIILSIISVGRAIKFSHKFDSWAAQ